MWTQSHDTVQEKPVHGRLPIKETVSPTWTLIRRSVTFVNISHKGMILDYINGFFVYGTGRHTCRNALPFLARIMQQIFRICNKLSVCKINAGEFEFTACRYPVVRLPREPAKRRNLALFIATLILVHC